MAPTRNLTGDDATATSESVFGRVVVGVDGTEPSFEACRLAARLADPSTPIEVVTVVHVAEAARAGFEAARIADELALEAELALDEAVRILGERAQRRSVDGYVMQSLLSRDRPRRRDGDRGRLARSPASRGDADRRCRR